MSFLDGFLNIKLCNESCLEHGDYGFVSCIHYDTIKSFIHIIDNCVAYGSTTKSRFGPELT